MFLHNDRTEVYVCVSTSECMLMCSMCLCGECALMFRDV